MVNMIKFNAIFFFILYCTPTVTQGRQWSQVSGGARAKEREEKELEERKDGDKERKELRE